MTDLVACLGSGKGSWSSVLSLVNSGTFEKCYLITSKFFAEKFNAPENTELIVIDEDKTESEIRDQIKESLQKIKGTEVALNLNSGTGKEHMALLSALLQSGLGIRLTIFEDQVKEL